MKTLFAFCFLGLLALLGGVAVFACLTKDRSFVAYGRGVDADAPVVTSFRAIYPFEGEPAGEDGKGANVLGTYQDFVRKWTAGISNYTSGLNPPYNSFRRVVGAYHRIVENVIENCGDPILRLDNGYYTCLFPYSDSAKTWDNIREFAAWLKERKIRCVHVLPPYKFDDRVTVFPEGIPHGYARMVAEYRQFMADSQIPLLDAADILRTENPNFYDWFYKVYLHYTAHAGLTIARATAQKLRDELDIAVDLEAVKDGNFTRSVYPGLYHENWAEGRDVGGDDIEAFYPRKDGDFHVEVPSGGLDRMGGFRDTLISQTYLESAFDCYRAFFYGYSPLIRVENLTCTNNTRVLVLRRCDAGVICPYMACAVRHLDVIIPEAFDGSIRTFIEKSKPDVVMFCTYMQTSADDPFWRLR